MLGASLWPSCKLPDHVRCRELDAARVILESFVMCNVSRRVFLTSTAASAAVALPTALYAEEAGASSVPLAPAPVKDGRSTLTPDEALDLLRQGN